jgi:hypothetical protein
MDKTGAADIVLFRSIVSAFVSAHPDDFFDVRAIYQTGRAKNSSAVNTVCPPHVLFPNH